MSETQTILILANSERTGGRCVAGKLANARPDGGFDVGTQWIRLTNPDGTAEGTVPYLDTVCRHDRTPVRPLDIIRVAIAGQCNNPDHPEDQYYERAQSWEWVASTVFSRLADVVDTPPSLWYDGHDDAVEAGYVRAMREGPSSIYLVRAPKCWTFTYFKEWDTFKGYEKKRRRLTFTFAGQNHDFSVTDSGFTRRHNIEGRFTNQRQILSVPNLAGCYFCVSLTPEFHGKHYKICATIFEP